MSPLPSSPFPDSAVPSHVTHHATSRARTTGCGQGWWRRRRAQWRVWPRCAPTALRASPKRTCADAPTTSRAPTLPPSAPTPGSSCT
eukprot:544429-Rhodomonas_salina.1